MDLSMPAGTPAPSHPRVPLAFEDQDAWGICGWWACRCTTSARRRLVTADITRHTPGRTTRLLITQAGVTGSIRPAVTR